MSTKVILIFCTKYDNYKCNEAVFHTVNSRRRRSLEQGVPWRWIPWHCSVFSSGASSFFRDTRETTIPILRRVYFPNFAFRSASARRYDARSRSLAIIGPLECPEKNCPIPAVICDFWCAINIHGGVSLACRFQIFAHLFLLPIRIERFSKSEPLPTMHNLLYLLYITSPHVKAAKINYLIIKLTVDRSARRCTMWNNVLFWLIVYSNQIYEPANKFFTANWLKPSGAV